MAHFYGVLEGKSGTATRCVTKESGLVATAAGWGGCVMVRVYRDEAGVDRYIVTLGPWKGSGGEFETIAQGILRALTTPIMRKG